MLGWIKFSELNICICQKLIRVGLKLKVYGGGSFKKIFVYKNIYLNVSKKSLFLYNIYVYVSICVFLRVFI